MGWRVKRKRIPTKRTISLADFFDAIEQNGLPQVRNSFWKYSNSANKHDDAFEVGAACAIGQAALNLGVDYTSLEANLYKFRNSKRQPLNSSIVERNDKSHWSYRQIANFYRRIYASRLRDTFEIHVTYDVEKD